MRNHTEHIVTIFGFCVVKNQQKSSISDTGFIIRKMLIIHGYSAAEIHSNPCQTERNAANIVS